MTWSRKELNQLEVRTLAQNMEMEPLEAAILSRRGVTRPQELKFFLEDDLRWTHNPFLFSQMEDAVDRILLARDEEERVLVFGDRDTDGITSTVILTETLRALGLKDVEWRVPIADDPYGLTRRAVNEFAARGGTLIVTVDCGITNISEVAYAKSLGIDTIIVDHHSVGEELPPALAIVNPKVPGERYPFPHLAACAVTAKLAWALRFADTEWYNQSFCILNATLGDGFLRVEAVKLVNLLEANRISLDFRENGQGREKQALASFLVGSEILVYGSSPQTSLLQSIFGRNVDIHLTDMAPQIAQAYPALAGVDLVGLRARSRMPRYQENDPSDLDILVSLFTSFFYKSKPGLSQDFIHQLDMVALGTLADMMPLLDENRVLVRQGLKQVNTTQRSGLRLLILQTKLGTRQLGAQDISWQLTPLINSSGRMGVPDKAVRLLLGEKEDELPFLAKEISALNEERKILSNQAWEKFLDPARQSVGRFRHLAFVASADIPRGITGILSNRLMNVLGLPALVLSLASETVVASLRSCRGFETRRFLESFQDLFLDFGGHAAAAGFQMDRSRLEDFTARLEATALRFPLDQENLDPSLDIDAELPVSLVTPEVLLRALDRLEPYGEGWPPLTFSVRRVSIDSIDTLGKGFRHLKLALGIGDTRWSAIRWEGAEDWGTGPWVQGAQVSAAFHVQRNYYQGKDSLQLLLQDLQYAP